MYIKLLEKVYIDPIKQDYLPQGTICQVINKKGELVHLRHKGFNYLVKDGFKWEEPKKINKSSFEAKDDIIMLINNELYTIIDNTYYLVKLNPKGYYNYYERNNPNE